MKAAQVGGSEAGLNLLGYIADVAQGPTILVCPTVEMAERHSETRIKPMIRLTRRLFKAFGDPDSKTAGQKVLLKKFPGGLLVITGANSGASLRSLPARYMIFEEPDAYPLTLMARVRPSISSSRAGTLSVTGGRNTSTARRSSPAALSSSQNSFAATSGPTACRARTLTAGRSGRGRRRPSGGRATTHRRRTTCVRTARRRSRSASTRQV